MGQDDHTDFIKKWTLNGSEEEIGFAPWKGRQSRPGGGVRSVCEGRGEPKGVEVGALG